MTDRQFKKGEVIFLEGDMGNTMFQIQEGTVSIYVGYAEEDQLLLTKIGNDRLFGEIAVIEACPRSTTAVANEEVRALEISSDEVMDYFRTQPDRIMEILKNLSRRLRELTSDYADACNTVREIGDSLDKEFGGALLELIIRFATEYRRNRSAMQLSIEAERQISHGGSTGDYSPKLQTYSKGTIIFREGEMGDCMYYIRSGAVGIYEGYGTSDEKLLTRLSADTFFGELGMIDNIERSCTAVVMERDTVIEVLITPDIIRMIETDPDRVKKILEHLSYRLRLLTVDYMNACRMIYRVDQARNSGRISEDLKSETKDFADSLVVIRSLKL